VSYRSRTQAQSAARPNRLTDRLDGGHKRGHVLIPHDHESGYPVTSLRVNVTAAIVAAIVT
jgi:hypothetical protein